jgi:Lipopolysaccharide assembly protein A domain
MSVINRFFGALVFWPLAIVVAAIAVANRKPVVLSFDPFNAAAPALSLSVPLYAVVLGAALIGLMLGGWSSYLAQAPSRRAARGTEQKVKKLEREIEVQQAIIVRPVEGRDVTPG